MDEVREIHEAAHTFGEIDVGLINEPGTPAHARLTPEDLAPMVQSIKRHGLLQPIMVLPREDGTYDIVTGKRRYLATKLAGIGTIRAAIIDPGQVAKNPPLVRKLALSEQLNRADLNVADRIMATLDYVKETVGFSDHHEIIALLRRVRNKTTLASERDRVEATIEAFADTGTSWQGFERHSAGYLTLSPELQQAVRAGDLPTLSTARLLNDVKNDEDRKRLTGIAVMHGYGYAETKALIREYHHDTDPMIAAMEESLELYEQVKNRLTPEQDDEAMDILRSLVSAVQQGDSPPPDAPGINT